MLQRACKISRPAQTALRQKSCVHSTGFTKPVLPVKHHGVRRVVCSAAAEDVPTSVRFEHLLLTILDSNEFLSDGSKQAVMTAALLARKDAGRVTVLVVAEPGTTASEPDKQVETITWHLRERGIEKFEVLQRATDKPASVLIGDVADEVMADMVVVSSEAVHAKYVDANQLAEFVACPLLVLP